MGGKVSRRREGRCANASDRPSWGRVRVHQTTLHPSQGARTQPPPLQTQRPSPHMSSNHSPTSRDGHVTPPPPHLLQLYILFPSKQSAFLPTYGISISVNSSALLASSWSQMNSSLPLISTERYKQLCQVFLKGSGRQVSHLLIVLCSSHLQVSAAAADTISFPACQLYPLWLPTASQRDIKVPFPHLAQASTTHPSKTQTHSSSCHAL